MPTVSFPVGTTQWVVPSYADMTVSVGGGGGGCANSGAVGSSGGNGQTSEFKAATNVYATGGGGGSMAYGYYALAGQYYWTAYPGNPGSGVNGNQLNTTGGGGAGATGGSPGQVGGNADGGPGGFAKSIYTEGVSGAPAPGTTVTVVVGARGGNSDGSLTAGAGFVTVDYTLPPASPSTSLNMPMLGM